jgi:type I restriction enzyme S subunit
MSWEKVKLGQFLKNREGRYKPNDKAIQGLRRIDKINFSGTIFLSDKPSNTDMILVKKGDLVISGINVEKGAMNIYQGDEDVVATIHYSSYEFDKKQIDVDFLTNFLKSLEFKKALKEQVPGGIKTEIKPKHILPLLVEIPIDINEQKKIVQKLTLNNSIVQNVTSELTYQFNIIKQLRQAFLREAMQGKIVKSTNRKETGQQLLEKIKAEKAKLIAEKKLKKEKEFTSITKDEIPFKIPEHWTWCRLGEVCSKIGSGSTPKGSNYAEVGKPFFRSQNIHDNGLVYDDIKFISDEIQKKMSGTIVLSNDILLNITGGSMARCALVPNDFKEGNVSQHVCIIRPLSLNNTFLHKLILSPYFQRLIFGSTTGTGREGLPKYNLEQFIIPLPPLHEQEQIVANLEELMIFCDGLEQNTRKSQGYNEKLLQQFLREALRLKSTEKNQYRKEKKTPNTKRIIKKFYTDGNDTFTTLKMKIVEILKTASEPLPANVVWNSSDFSGDIEMFYAELKKLIDIEKVVVEEKIGMESYLKLASYEN